MRARQLEVFRAVMRSGTVTGAAKALNVSQPALSQIILHTEDELGFRLFERVKGRLVPTPEAEELFPEADRLFNDLDNLRSLALDLRHGAHRRLGTAFAQFPATRTRPLPRSPSGRAHSLPRGAGRRHRDDA